MSKYNIKYSLSLVVAASSVFFMGCPTAPEFPDKPSIAFQDVNFEQRGVTGQQNVTEDVITISLAFEDGDGDLGLSSNDINKPYNQYDLRFTQEGELIYVGDNDTLPAYNPLDYIVVPEGDSAMNGNAVLPGDTIYIVRNARFYNIFIKMFYKPGGKGDFVEFDWEDAPYFQSFNGRFPILNTEEYARPLNGELTYEIKSAGFRPVFREDPIIIETYILDRAGNKSNTVQSKPFQLLID